MFFYKDLKFKYTIVTRNTSNITYRFVTFIIMYV